MFFEVQETEQKYLWEVYKGRKVYFTIWNITPQLQSLNMDWELKQGKTENQGRHRYRGGLEARVRKQKD